jgi:hypothetical protein
MKILALTGIGRSGLDLFHSLLDSHPEVAQFPGCFFFDEFWLKIINQKNLSNIANKFILDYKKFFDSRLNLPERHYMLGENKNSFYLVDEKKFRQHFIKLFENKEINKKNVLYNLHFAYSLASEENLEKKKIIILNLHHIYRLKILKEFDYEVIYTIRDPIAALCSATKHRLKYNDGRDINPWSLYFHIERIFNGLRTVTKLGVKAHIVQLELLHRQNIKVMKEVAEKFNINYNQKSTSSTYHGKLWWGDKLSGKDLNGINPDFKNNIDYNFFYKKDIQCFEKYLNFFMKKYNYQIFEKKLRFSAIKILPLKIEIEVWKKTILSMRIKEILSIFYYWIKRINLMKDDIYKNINFPDPIGK